MRENKGPSGSSEKRNGNNSERDNELRYPFRLFNPLC